VRAVCGVFILGPVSEQRVRRLFAMPGAWHEKLRAMEDSTHPSLPGLASGSAAFATDLLKSSYGTRDQRCQNETAPRARTS
jgi:hypothetical protein